MPAIGNDRQREALAAETAQELAKGPTASCVELTKILHAQQTLPVFSCRQSLPQRQAEPPLID